MHSSSADAHVAVGSLWSDNYDPERHPRIVEVRKVVGNRVVVQTVERNGKRLSISGQRMTETDISRFGKPGRTGFTFVSAPPEGNQ